MDADNVNRRNFLKTCAFGTGVLGLSLEEKALLAQNTAKTGEVKAPQPAADMPMGTIGKLKISRLICGGNLINGYAHARDMIYVSSLLKHYFTDEKIMETWELCEQCGINTMISTIDDPYAGGNDPTGRTIKKYWDERGGQIQWLAQYFPKPDDPFAKLQMAIDAGAHGRVHPGRDGRPPDPAEPAGPGRQGGRAHEEERPDRRRRVPLHRGAHRLREGGHPG